MAKEKRETLSTPKAPCKWPWLKKPNTRWKEEGEYSVQLVFDPDDPFIAKIQAMAEEGFEEIKAGMKPAKAKKAELVLPFTPEEDEEGEDTGNVLVNFKMYAQRIDQKTGKVVKMKPRIFDSANKMMKFCPNIGNGSVLNVNCTPIPTLVKGKVYLSFWMNAVRINELVEFAPDGSSMFGEGGDGYDSDEFDNPGTVDAEDDLEDNEEF